MWVQGVLEVVMRWNQARRRRTRGGLGRVSEGAQQVVPAVSGSSWAAVSNGLKAALLLVLTRCVYPGLARALMLEVFTLALHPVPGFVVTVAAVLGGVGLPISRVAYRLWYVSSHRRGSWWGLPRLHACPWCTGVHVHTRRILLAGSTSLQHEPINAV